MPEWEDYYKILQVHFMAEQEVIESAYKRLSKKYHPDVNKSINAEETMKNINKAYEILNNPVTRKQYFIRWLEKYSGLDRIQNSQTTTHLIDFSFEPIKNVLIEYLNFITKHEFDSAFELISENDKKCIPRKDFIKWQTVVSEVFELKSFECCVKNVYSDINIKHCFFETVVDFNVKAVEINNIMDMLEKDEFSKSVVLENNMWRIFLGYKELGSIINKFDDLANLKKQKLKNKKKLQRQSNIDSKLGLLNKKGFTEKAQNEQTRHDRYGNVFSIILCEFDECDKWSEIRYNAVRQVAEVINSSLRSLDLSCRWKGKKFIILLPETDSASANKVACKIQKKICQMINNQGEYYFSMSFIVAQQAYDSLNDLITITESYMKQVKITGSKVILNLDKKDY
jgi:diguanylate cyclase (GGDEF)-like protein